MSIRTNPMKAVPLVLKHLANAERHADLKDLKCELIKIKDLFSIVKKNEDELLDTLTVLYGYLRNSNVQKLLQEKQDICKRIRISALKLLPADAIQTSDTEPAQSSALVYKNVKIHKRQEMNTAQPSCPHLEVLERFKLKINNLRPSTRSGFRSLLHFPENAVVKKSNMLLWLHSVRKSVMPLVWESETNVFDELLDGKRIVPHGNGKCPVVNKFKINPWFRHKLWRPQFTNDPEQFCGIYSQIITSSNRNDTRYDCLALDQRKVKLSDGFDFKSNHWTAVINFGASYLNFGPQWLAKLKHLEVLQLGRWLQESPTHHIEVESEEFLKELRQQKHLWYLSLRGISGISELPPSILQLENLQVLDLKACHNLETLPDAIASLKKLRYLDLSQCYLLDRMPKGIDKLTGLEVLKGFVIGSSSKTPCRISDLANLRYLQRLSIHLGSGAVIQDKEFESLKDLTRLEHLKISWGVSDTSYSGVQVILPSRLRKLHLEGFPGQEIPNWLKPGRELKELKITGGKLKSMNHGQNNDHWWLEIVRLKFIKHLKVDLTNLQELFPELRYVEIRQILNHSYLEWSIND